MENLKTNLMINEEKSIKNTLLYIRNVNINIGSYESKILLEDNIENVIKCQVVYEGENRVLKYDVSGSMSLDEYIRAKKLKKEDICRVVIAIDEVLMSIENYLLSENSLSLEPKLVRVVKKANNHIDFKFIAIPDYNSNFSYELSKFLIRLLRHVDVDDKDALSLAYGLFVRSSKDNYTMNDLMELVDKAYDKRETESLDFSVEDMVKYDEEIANEISEEIIEENRMAGFTEVEEMDNDNVTIKSDDEGIIIDSETKNILADNILNDFDYDDKKIKSFEKKPLLLKTKRALKGNISIGIIGYILAPIILIVAPLIYYFLIL